MKIGGKQKFGYSSRGKIWDRDLKNTKDNFGRKGKSNGYNCLPVSQYREAECYLNLRSCLQDADIFSSPRIGKYINKILLYNQCHPRIVKDTNMSHIKNS